MAKIRLIKKINGKKAVLMTVTALLISLLFLYIYGKDNFIPSYYSSQSTNTRIKMMDEFSKSVPNYAGDALEISTYSALNSIYLHYSKAGGIFPDQSILSNELKNCIKCGYLNGCEAAPIPCPGMKGTDLNSFFMNLSTLASKDFNIKFDYDIDSMSVDVVQKYPYDVDVTLVMSYYVEDNSTPDKFSRWEKSENITRVVSIIGLNDPLTGIPLGVNKPVKRTAICQGNETCWDLNKTRAFYNEQSFKYSPNGTSFISRYWNSTESSRCCGIESMLNVSLINSSTNSSFLDHYYFSGIHTCDEDVILGYDSITPGFKLDSKTAGRFGISDLGVLICS
ncbi:MAG: hypothetical protein ACP5NV_00490 [Candidatus Woesearchaeota archaeon]